MLRSAIVAGLVAVACAEGVLMDMSLSSTGSMSPPCAFQNLGPRVVAGNDAGSDIGPQDVRYVQRSDSSVGIPMGGMSPAVELRKSSLRPLQATQVSHVRLLRMPLLNDGL